MSDLEQAIQLIRQGNKAEAQRLLQGVLRSDPRNIQAWFWYVETCSTAEQRIQTLQACLKMNPSSQRVMQALQLLQQQKPPTPAVQPQPYQPSSTFREEPPDIENNQAVYGYDAFSPDDFTSTPAAPPAKEKAAWETMQPKYEDDSLLSKPKKQQPVRSLSTFDVWMTVTTVQDVKAYEETLDDPGAGLGRAFTWMAIAGVVNALVFPILFLINPQFSELASMPEFEQMTRSVNMSAFMVLLTVSMLFIVPIGSVVNLAITGGIQHFLAVMFGGTGNYTRTVYALAAFLAPMTIVTSIATVIPFVGQCLTLPLGIYNIVLNVRALKAAHSISTGAALGALFAPGILVMIFACLILFLGGASLPGS